MVGLQETPISGFYTSGGVAFNVPLRFSPDRFSILNYTQMATTQNPGRVVKSEWRRGFLGGYAYTGTKTNSSSAMNETIATSGGYTLINTIDQTLGSAVTLTAITSATPPVVSTASTAGLIAGDTVRIVTATGARQIAGMDFTIGTIVTNTSFELSYGVAMGAAVTAGSYRKVFYDPVWAPRRRYITAITQAASAVVTLSVTHDYQVGEKIQFFLGAQYGMIQLNGKVGRITAINTTTNTITVDIDTSGFTAFAFPGDSTYPLTFAQTVPVGEIPTVTTGVTANEAIIAINVGSAVCGAASDVLYWEASKSFEYYSGTLPVFP